MTHTATRPFRIAAALLVGVATATATIAQDNQRKVWINASAAATEDPDFALQGEYASASGGVQIIALGKGRFRMVSFGGGLPGLGWDGKTKAEREGTSDEIRAALKPPLQKIRRASTTLGMTPAKGATVLFDGTKASLANWKKGARMTENGLLMEGATSIPTFGSGHVHVEFQLPYKPEARGQGRGNSGLYLQGRYETQMLDSFGLAGKHNECGGIYSVRDPDLNMCLPPLSWQTYDIDFRAAEFDDQGKKTRNARMTVRLNGVVIHGDVEVPKRTTASPLKEGPDGGPIYLQNHGNPVRYRNIWVAPK